MSGTFRLVLLEQTIAAIDPRPGMVVVDCTVGLGGHSSALLETDLAGRKASSGSISIRLRHLEIARSALATTGGVFELYHNNFAALPTVIGQARLERIDAILAGLGRRQPADRRPRAADSLTASPARWT